MPYQLKPGEDISHAAQALLGDARMIHEIHVVHGTAYLKAERMGPPAKWAAAPPATKKKS
jgi:hypothetical protein